MTIWNIVGIMLLMPCGGHEGAKASKVQKVPTVFKGAHARKGELSHPGQVSVDIPMGKATKEAKAALF